MTLKPHEAGGYTHSEDPGEPGYNMPRISVSDEEATILAAVVQDRTVLEIGTGLGVASRAMAETARYVVTIDVDPWVKDKIWPILPQNVRPQLGREKVLNERFQVVFIDGYHETEAVEQDIAFALDHVVEEKGLIILHDTKSQGILAVAEAYGLKVYTVSTAHGLGFAYP